MKRKHYIYGLQMILSFALLSCASGNNEYGNQPEGWNYQTGTPRLVVKGTVTNTADEPLQGVFVTIFGVREPGENDMLSYNYAITDSVGNYTIVRYRGRELPTEVTVIATDSTGVYQEQLLFATLTYDSISTPSGKQPFNAFVTVDFVLAPF
ncbi:MAG: hypothetical protein IKQ50_05335 [Paludibacteraceae bacterium]|nr:hypothetical protein [Paludibacteraceae bacterium]